MIHILRKGFAVIVRFGCSREGMVVVYVNRVCQVVRLTEYEA